jgi:hypothetical protein
MKTNASRNRLAGLLGLALLTVVLTACGQYSAPITEQATRKINATLIGDWASADRKVRIKIRELNETAYVVTYNGILFKAFHSDFSGVSFVSVQELETPERSFTYLAYRTSDDGQKLYLRLVNKEVIPDDVQTASAVRLLLRDNLQNPALFHTEQTFIKEQWSPWSTIDVQQ